MRRFPLAYDIVFTPGNMDESLEALVVGHRRIVRLMNRPELSQLTRIHPHVIFRSYRRYLASSFTKKQRRAAFENHYVFLTSRLKSAFFDEITRVALPIWVKTIEMDSFSITLSFPGELHDGALMLEFRQNDISLFSLSFSIGPGCLAGSDAPNAILVARVQGRAGRFETIRQATKKCHDVSPCYLLMAALQGISAALSVGIIAGVKTSEQVTADYNVEDKTVHFDYDALWRTLLGTEGPRFYLMPVPLPEKSLALISSPHRRRTRAKRKFKSEVIEMSKNHFAEFLTAPAEASCRS